VTADLDLRLLASLPSVDAFELLEQQGIGEQAFGESGRAIYHYIAEVTREHRHLPRLQDLRATFNLPDWVQRKPEEYDWLLSEFQRLRVARRVQEVVDRDVELYGEDPTELVGALIRDLGAISVDGSRTGTLTDATAVARMDGYERAAGSAEMIAGIPTGFGYFDAAQRIGWMRGELVGIIGRTYVGKTWILLYSGLRAWATGHRVLFLSPELPKDEAEARFDALVCGMNGVTVNLDDLYRGYVPTDAQRLLAAKTAERGNWITLTSAEGQSFRVTEIPRLIRQYQPDLVLVDGLPLIGGGGGRQVWEQIKDVSYGLKNIAQGAEIVIMVAHQANRSAHNTARPPGLHEISYGDAFAQACDRVLVLSQPRAQPNQLKVTVQKFRKGRPAPGGIDLHFEPGHGKIFELERSERSDVERPDGADRIGSARESIQIGIGAADDLPIP